MGKGDKKTRKGKINMGSFGKLCPRRGKFRIRKKAVKEEVINNTK